KRWNWAVSEGFWTIGEENSLLANPAKEGEAANLKRDLGKFQVLTVEMRGDGDAAGFSFGKGMRFLAKPTEKWQTLKLDVMMDDVLRLQVNGDTKKSLDDIGNLKTKDLPS